MRRTMLPFFVIIIFVFGIHMASAQWVVWDCSIMPTEVDTSWHLGGDDEEVQYGSIIDDPDITGNKLFKVEEPLGTPKETWYVNWNASSLTGVTVVFRAKGLSSGNYDRDWDIYVQNGEYRERLVSNGGTELKFDKSKAAIPYDTSVWHVYRITSIGSTFEVYIDEVDFSELYTDAGDPNTANQFLFGDNGGSTIGTLYDWIIFDVSGAYPPGQGTPLPEDLTGNPLAIDKVSLVKPDNFSLEQNYPNPFNPSTDIQFSLDRSGQVRLTIYDVNGRTIRHLVDEVKQPGTYKVHWNGYDMSGQIVPSGVYFYTLQSSSFSATKKMIMLK